LICLLFVNFNATSQTIHGIVVDQVTRLPLTEVSIINISTQRSTTTGSDGHYTLPAAAGDSLSFFAEGYTAMGLRLTQTNMPDTLAMANLHVQLKEFVLHKQLTQYQQDSIERRKTYEDGFKREKIKPQYTGLAVNDLFSSIAQHFSYKDKLRKKFKKNFEEDEEQRFIDTRYTQKLTHDLTGLTGEELAKFMNTYPMSYGFARSATDLEIKMWIRDNYKDHLKHP